MAVMLFGDQNKPLSWYKEAAMFTQGMYDFGQRKPSLIFMNPSAFTYNRQDFSLILAHELQHANDLYAGLSIGGRRRLTRTTLDSIQPQMFTAILESRANMTLIAAAERRGIDSDIVRESTMRLSKSVYETKNTTPVNNLESSLIAEHHRLIENFFTTPAGRFTLNLIERLRQECSTSMEGVSKPVPEYDDR